MRATIPPDQAHRLLPLLRSIGEEILERAARLERLEKMVSALSISPRAHATELSLLHADLAEEKRELRYAERELENLDCRIDDISPLTFLVLTEADRGYTWRLGDTELTESLP